MLYMVIEHFRDADAAPVYRRLEREGRMLPPGLAYVESWVADDRTRCFQLMECGDPALLEVWMDRWRDLVRFEVVPVIASTAAAGGGDARG